MLKSLCTKVMSEAKTCIWFCFMELNDRKVEAG